MASVWGMKLMSSKGSSAASQQSVKDAKERLRRMLRDIDTVPQEELQRSARAIYEEAVARAPYKTGQLERSIYVRVSKDKRRGGLVAGASAKSSRGYDYAGIQHENTSFNHPVKGEAHFISDPFNKETDCLIAQLRRRLKPK